MGTTTVKEIIEKVIMSSPEDDVEVDTIIEQFPEFDRIDIVSAMKMLELEKVGVLIVGRRKKKSRFRRGYMRLPTNLDKESLELLRNCILTLDKGTEFPLDGSGSFSRNATEFFHGNKNHAVEALKLLETEGLGVFLIGRRKLFSRFIKGICRDDLLNKTKTTTLVKIVKETSNVIDFFVKEQALEEVNREEQSLEVIDSSLSRYTIISGIMFKSDLGEIEDGFPSIEEALSQAGYCNMDLKKLNDDLVENGFSKLEDFKNVVNI